jgi:2-C-methyl-D-erythritol 2,4-cyclodiphosphate synthase
MNKIRIGHGYDVHQWAENRKLVIGGIEITFEKGLLGHSDADVLLHAISDALLGALALGDIGLHFSDTLQENKDIDSKIILAKCYEMVKENGFILGNIDSTIVMQRPKLRPYIDEMRTKIADVLACDISQISIKATTSEKLGFVGREEGVEAFASVLIYK